MCWESYEIYWIVVLSLPAEPADCHYGHWTPEVLLEQSTASAENRDVLVAKFFFKIVVISKTFSLLLCVDILGHGPWTCNHDNPEEPHQTFITRKHTF